MVLDKGIHPYMSSNKVSKSFFFLTNTRIFVTIYPTTMRTLNPNNILNIHSSSSDRLRAITKLLNSSSASRISNLLKQSKHRGCAVTSPHSKQNPIMRCILNWLIKIFFLHIFRNLICIICVHSPANDWN